jgi:hypothetical protein
MGSIAVIERFWKTAKGLLGLRSFPPLTHAEARRRVELALFYYAYLRPHQSLQGATPAEVFFGLVPAHRSAQSPPALVLARSLRVSRIGSRIWAASAASPCFSRVRRPHSRQRSSIPCRLAGWCFCRARTAASAQTRWKSERSNVRESPYPSLHRATHQLPLGSTGVSIRERDWFLTRPSTRGTGLLASFGHLSFTSAFPTNSHCGDTLTLELYDGQTLNAVALA